jgi:uncharacterized membrane protein YozB (DUF420 family)
MFDISMLPHFQASMNLLCTVSLLSGYYFIKKENQEAHKKCMVTALSASAIFLVSYLVYHYNVGTYRFGGEGSVRSVYFTILLTHTVLSIAMLPMVAFTVYRAFRQDFERHPKIARWTLPVWLYVSVTGIVIYAMLYHIYTPIAPAVGA